MIASAAELSEQKRANNQHRSFRPGNTVQNCSRRKLFRWVRFMRPDPIPMAILTGDETHGSSEQKRRIRS